MMQVSEVTRRRPRGPGRAGGGTSYESMILNLKPESHWQAP